jgi:hypothetical protein
MMVSVVVLAAVRLSGLFFLLAFPGAQAPDFRVPLLRGSLY